METGKIYILGVAGNGTFSKLVQIASESLIPQEKRWSHVAVAFWHWVYRGWVVIESVYPYGVRLVSLEYWTYENWNKQIVEAFEYPHVVPSKLVQNIGKEYAVRDIARLARQRFTPLKFETPEDANKEYCAELVADCDNGFISTERKLKSWQVVPVDLQEWGAKNSEIFDFRKLVTELADIESLAA